MEQLPQHLKKYIVEQDYAKYTARDHSAWRFILRQLKSFLTEHAHKSYLDGLNKTGIDIELIPKISEISSRLETFGWRALPVSGFIPPAAFMELQSLSVLPIASDMRSIDHLLYTPAPDIVHEAAGHAPFLADPEYADYLKQYAQVAKKAIISREDLELYEAIRELSDIKENPSSTKEQISNAEKALQEKSAQISFVSEAAELSRMNWWTAEYGLVGNLESPKIFGAGLLSSVGESKWCLSEKVKKIPLSVNCIKQSYDITEPQPQLFVAHDFNHLKSVLHDLSQTLAYKTGGADGLKKAVQAETVNTVEFENGIQISGILNNFKHNEHGEPIYLQFSGPTQICVDDTQLAGHGKDHHTHGYGTPIGPYIFNSDGALTSLRFESGVEIQGLLTHSLKLGGRDVILSLSEATCKLGEEILFLPEWGMFDIVLAEQVVSVFAGPADREAYGEIEDFVATRVQQPNYTESQFRLFESYRRIRELRAQPNIDHTEISNLCAEFEKEHPTEWLLFMELLELSIKRNMDRELNSKIESRLNKISIQNENLRAQIDSGISLAHAKY